MRKLAIFTSLFLFSGLLLAQEEFAGFKESHVIDASEGGGNAHKVFVTEDKSLLVIKYGGIKQGHRSLVFIKMEDWSKIAEIPLKTKEVDLMEAYYVPEENQFYARKPKSTLYYRVDIKSGKVKGFPCKKTPLACVKIRSKFAGSITGDSFRMEDDIIFARRSENLRKVQVYTKD